MKGIDLMALKYNLEFKRFSTCQYIAIWIVLWEIEILIIFNAEYHCKEQPTLFQTELKR